MFRSLKCDKTHFVCSESAVFCGLCVTIIRNLHNVAGLVVLVVACVFKVSCAILISGVRVNEGFFFFFTSPKTVL